MLKIIQIMWAIEAAYISARIYDPFFNGDGFESMLALFGVPFIAVAILGALFPFFSSSSSKDEGGHETYVIVSLLMLAPFVVFIFSGGS